MSQLSDLPDLQPPISAAQHGPEPPPSLASDLLSASLKGSGSFAWGKYGGKRVFSLSLGKEQR